MKGVCFLVVCTIVVGNSVFCIVPVSATEQLTYKRNSVSDCSNNCPPLCSEKRLQQIQQWMPEYCPSLRDVYNGSPDLRLCDSQCGKTCGQYLYEGMKECYGNFAAFQFEQEYVFNGTGAECYQLQHDSIFHLTVNSVNNYCNSGTLNLTFCASRCSNYIQYLSELYGCCLATIDWLQNPTQLNLNFLQFIFNICNVSTFFCAPVFSQSIIGLPPEVYDNSTFSDSKILGLAAGLSTLAFIALLIISSLLLLMFIWRIKKKKQGRSITVMGNVSGPVDSHTCIEEDISIAHDNLEHNSSIINVLDASRRSSIEEIKMFFPQSKLYSSEQIELRSTIGEGESGLVYRAFLKSGGVKDMVAIKTGKAIFTKTDTRVLLKEVTTMLSFDHPNVMSLIGICLDTSAPLIIMPFMANGSIREYVKSHKEELHHSDKGNEEEQIMAAKLTLLGMCHQIAKGMCYLAGKKFVHRDLAARNCMIDLDGTIKVGDFGLTEDMYGSNYYRKSETTNERVPIRWMAPESIEEDVYNEKTDVWSFGVTCWEVFTCGRVPFSGIKAMSLLTALRNGERLERPINAACSDEIYQILLQCWEAVPRQRPKFRVLVHRLSHILEQDGGYLELSVSTTKIY